MTISVKSVFYLQLASISVCTSEGNPMVLHVSCNERAIQTRSTTYNSS
jgi:hypothetical protein